MRKRCGALLLSILLIFSFSSISHAANVPSDRTIITPFYEYITLVGADLTIGSGGKSVSSGFVYYSGGYNSTITVTLQRSSGSGWSNVKSWSESFSGAGYHSVDKEYYVVSGYSYRVVTSVTIKNGNTILETASSTSASVYY